MTNVLDDIFSSNKTAEEDGVWVDVNSTIKFRVRSYSAKAVSDLRDKLTLPFKMLLRTGLKIPDDQNEAIGLQVIAGAVLADWKGITATQGEGDDAVEVQVPYAPETALEYLTRLPRLANFIIGVATDNEFFKAAEILEDGAKKLLGALEALLAKKTDKNAEWMAELRAQGIVAPSAEPEVPEVEVYQDLLWAWNAFWRLSASRDVGFDRPIRLKVSEIKAFADIQEFSNVKTRDLLFYVDKLDERWMEHVNDLREEEEEKRRKANKNNQTPAKPPRRR